MADIVIDEKDKGYQCEVILDSVNPVGIRLVSMRLKYPLIVHSEMCRHRCFSRSVASNRAIPTAKIIAMVEQDPFVPIYWGKNQPGMAAEEEIEPSLRVLTTEAWLSARYDAIESVEKLEKWGVHKQIANRLLNPFQWVTEVITGTDWANFFALRCHPAAQPEIRRIAEMAKGVYDTSTPAVLREGEWHLPFVRDEDYGIVSNLMSQPISPTADPLLISASPEAVVDTLKKVSAARCARTSYRTHEGKISTIEEDVKLYDRLVGSDPKHASPAEHQARALPDDMRVGNFRGWFQHRYELPNHTMED